MESKQIQDNIQHLQNEYYQTHSKNRLFKSKQKQECASMIAQQMDINTLFQHTLYIIPNQSAIYFEYPIFKTFVCPENFNLFLHYIDNVTTPWINQCESYELHLNVHGLTISGFERFSGLMESLFQHLPPVHHKMKHIYIYYTPAVVDTIMRVMRPFIAHYLDKIVFYSKKESEEKLAEFTLQCSSSSSSA
jgi:hypothetical protein